MARKRILNRRTGKYYRIRQRTTKNGRKGQIMGLYRQPDGRPSIVRFLEDF